MDEIEQFVNNVAAMGLNGECMKHEYDCGLNEDDCEPVERPNDEEHDLLMSLIVEAREILQRANQ